MKKSRKSGQRESSIGPGGARRLKDHGLSLAMFGLFALFFAGHALSGWLQHNEEQAAKGDAKDPFGRYLSSGDFLESVAENWESEFLQMAGFVVLSASLYQRGAAESKKPDDDPEADESELDADPAARRTPDSPWPVHRGGLALAVYRRSLSLALGLLFAASFMLHAATGAMRESEEAREHGRPPVTLWQYAGTSKFWFESFQNWQSEFLSVGVLIVLSIFLRQQGSPESKPVHAPHQQTGAS